MKADRIGRRCPDVDAVVRAISALRKGTEGGLFILECIGLCMHSPMIAWAGGRINNIGTPFNYGIVRKSVPVDATDGGDLIADDSCEAVTPKP